MGDLLRYAALGLAVGGRATAGPAAVAWTGSNEAARKVTAGAALVELVGDKLPQAPSRLDLGGLLARTVSAAGSSIVLARRRGEDQRLAAMTAMTAALLGAAAGHRWRTVAAGRNVAAGLAEDAVVVACAAHAVLS